MRLPQSNFVQGGYYHVFNRGNRKQNVFHQTRDYKRYLESLAKYKDRHDISILAYCLMPNHVHFLIRQNGPKPISAFFQRLHTAYTMYFNKKYGFTGHVFESRFKTKVVGRDEYLMHLTRYIHLNPKSLVTRLPAYKWSSYPTYLSQTKDEITEPNFVLSMFKRKNQTKEDAILSYKLFVRSEEIAHKSIDRLTFPHD